MNKIMNLTGLSFGVASAVLSVLDYASYISLLMALTGIGIGAAAAIIAYKVAIKKILWTVGKAAAVQL